MRRLTRIAPLAMAVVCLLGAAPALAANGTGVSGTPTVTPQKGGGSATDATSTTIGGGATVVPSTRTVAHWWSSTTNPNDGLTYGYNMVGSDPFGCSDAGCATTVQADITPIIVHFDGMTYDATADVPAVLASPQFATDDYGSTPAATASGSFPSEPLFTMGPGGPLSQGDAGLQLQLEDATMRAQFDKVGAGSPYHLMLHPDVLPAVTIDVPSNQGFLYQDPDGFVFPVIDLSYWAAQINNLENSADPTHLPIYLTNDVLLGSSVSDCCTIGFHGTKASGKKVGYGKSQGNASVQTFAWASWVIPGTYPRVTTPPADWAIQDIHALSHEISEWADDPFVDNAVQPWLTPTAPQYGCSPVLETGDPVVGIGFAMGTNAFEQGSSNGYQIADGHYHPEDETFLPWFMRAAPNTISEPTQSPSANVGRYTLMGDLNPFAGFRQPATGC
jgi:hypothetical protein